MRERTGIDQRMDPVFGLWSNSGTECTSLRYPTFRTGRVDATIISS
jgi:hypothetical protein